MAMTMMTAFPVLRAMPIPMEATASPFAMKMAVRVSSLRNLPASMPSTLPITTAMALTVALRGNLSTKPVAAPEGAAVNAVIAERMLMDRGCA